MSSDERQTNEAAWTTREQEIVCGAFHEVNEVVFGGGIGKHNRKDGEA